MEPNNQVATAERPPRIRPARRDDIAAMQAIEVAAGRLFSSIGMHDIAAHAPLDSAVLIPYIDGNRAWIADVENDAVGYAIADVIDGCGHLEQVSVRPEYGRRGIGRALIGMVAAWATSESFAALTLLTFRDVPWNGPYYVSLGFRPVPDADLGPELRRLREHEEEIGLDREARLAMRLPLA